jgi:uncharacterized protein (TIGR03382 family)
MPLVRLMDGSRLNLDVSCAGGGGNPNALFVSPGAVRVRAVDWAGQEGPEVELGKIPANVCSGAPSAGASSGGGCQAGGIAGPAPLLPVVLLAAAVLGRRRRD